MRESTSAQKGMSRQLLDLTIVDLTIVDLTIVGRKSMSKIVQMCSCINGFNVLHMTMSVNVCQTQPVVINFTIKIRIIQRYTVALQGVTANPPNHNSFCIYWTFKTFIHSCIYYEHECRRKGTFLSQFTLCWQWKWCYLTIGSLNIYCDFKTIMTENISLKGAFVN